MTDTGWLAYIDPGTGSLILQVLVAGCMTVVFFFKNVRLGILAFCARLFGRSAVQDESEQTGASGTPLDQDASEARPSHEPEQGRRLEVRDGSAS
jgi:hypothetical protein